ncbi:MFS transporter [Pelomonas sp. SE-A7]|uniref:MFS transporter n=1 Tax=Pelomonas sp. SE-A7 TaxID=3054953 RepID=UPI00259CEE99|nr:MFS transporter [Pelomonas sp. SE-A7]MDM4764454.1 MFS transporter [Pelomonas sp. SE-A7]
MHLPHDSRPGGDNYLIRPAQAWFAFAMTFGLMLFDYIDRQVIVSLFPYIKADWGLSDKQLGGLVSVISVVVAIGGLPVALLADRYSRVKSVVVMATVWSLASISCMFARSYGQLFAARALVGAGEAGYGSVGAALIASLFPRRLRSALLGAFFAAASLGSVLGVLLGGWIAAHWGWQAAFGAVGVPGLALALLYMLVRDYKTVDIHGQTASGSYQTVASLVRRTVHTLARNRTLVWVCSGAAMQLIVVSSIWSWLPSFLNRYHSLAADVAGRQAALVVLAGALGGFIWGTVVDRCSLGRARLRLLIVAGLCLLTLLIFVSAFALMPAGPAQFGLILAGGFVMACTVGPISAVVFDVIHPAMRATGAAVLSLAQNLLGLAVGPFLTGWLSDQMGLNAALSLVPLFGLLAAAAFVRAMRTYESDMRAVANVRISAE